MFIVADYAANYPGNFIASLSSLERRMEGEIHFIYFLRDETQTEFLNWVALFSKTHECYRIAFDKSGQRTINREINEKRPSYVYFHFTGLSFLYGIYRKMSKEQRETIKLIQHIHSNPRAKGGIKKRLKHLASKYLCPKSVFFIACSGDAWKIIVEDYHRQKVYLCPNKVDFTRLVFHPGKQPHLEDSMTALTFCYNYHVKGGDIAAAVAKKLHNLHSSFRLYMVVASHEEEIKAHLEKDFPDYRDYIDILPPSNEVANIYALSPIYLLPSRTEGFPYAMIEACYSGLTIVCSDLPALGSINLPRVYFFPVGNSNKAADLIEKAYNSDVEKKENSFFDQYGLDIWAKKEEEIIRDIDNA